MDSNGKKVYLLDWVRNNIYEFKSLPIEELGMPGLLAEDDKLLGKFEIFGQIYNELPGDLPPGIEILALDDQGNVIDKAITDKYGNFRFTKLDAEQFYVYTIAEADSVSLTVVVTNTTGSFRDTLLFSDLSKYLYHKLQQEYATIARRKTDEAKSIWYLLSESIW